MNLGIQNGGYPRNAANQQYLELLGMGTDQHGVSFCSHIDTFGSDANEVICRDEVSGHGDEVP